MTPETDLIQQVADLLREAGRAHHQAFTATDGEDPEWPIWYADYLRDRLGKLLNATFTRSELAYLLVSAEKEQAVRAPEADWAAHYARFLLRQA